MNALDEDCIPPRLLIIDHHDSYTHNLLICLLDGLAERIGGKIPSSERAREIASNLLLSRTTILPYTHSIWQDEKQAKQILLKHFDALILSPGPGRPENVNDFGASMTILQSFLNNTQDLLPTLGICLGHQGIAIACGGRLKRANNLRHGMSSQLIVKDNSTHPIWPSILDNVQQGTSMTTYNSLVVDEGCFPENLQVTAYAMDAPVEIDESKREERVVMALQHITHPIWGVQFHPESIASHGGHTILTDFLANTHTYWKRQSESEHTLLAKRAMSKLNSWRQAEPVQVAMGTTLPAIPRNIVTPPLSLSYSNEDPIRYTALTQPLGKYDPTLAPNIFKKVISGSQSDNNKSASVWLDSARPGGHHSRYSFMSEPSWCIRYDVKSKTISAKCDEKRTEFVLQEQGKNNRSNIIQKHGLPTPELSRTNSPETPQLNEQEEQSASFWTWLDHVQQDLQKICDTSQITDIPFKTGFVGYFGYEMKYESLPKTAFPDNMQEWHHHDVENSSPFPSSWFGFCDKALVIDHETGQWYTIGLVQNPARNFDHIDIDHLGELEERLNIQIGLSSSQWEKWTESVLKTLSMINEKNPASVVTNCVLPSMRPINTADEYMRKVERARELISEGQSYEICLTTEFQGQLSGEIRNNRHFDLYTSLRARNPAPFSAFLQLDSFGNGDKPQSILSTSPEKFFGIDADGLVEMKPIKGTAARAGYGKGEKDILQKVRNGDMESIQWCKDEDQRRIERLHADAKERAENLMIVDLIRRDLLHSCRPESVKVTKLMAIESYETVHQLVTTVQGQKIPIANKFITNNADLDICQDGIGTVEAIRQCFPPGSMTGAPKKRSVQLLEDLEHAHSQRKARGVYSGTLGWLGVDGAANFNVVIRTICLNGKEISVGAGGAITYHSKPTKEWQEVLDKVGAIAPVDLSGDIE